MSSQYEIEFAKLKEEFNKQCKRVLKENVSKNPVKHVEYLTDIPKSYNSIISYVTRFYDSLDEKSRKDFQDERQNFIDKISQVYQKLGVTLATPVNLLDLLNIESIISNYEVNSGTRIMAPTADDKRKFIAQASQVITKNYDGDSLSLNSFINSVNLMRNLTDDEYMPLLIQFVITKLGESALECVPSNPRSLDEIIRGLRSNILPDTVDEIAGDLLALKFDRNKISDFTEQADKLSKAYKRALARRGIPLQTAQEMSVEKMIEVCLNLTQSSFVRSVLASKQFATPHQVVAAFAVRSKEDEKHKQVLAFQNHKRQSGGGQNNRNQNGKKGNWQRNGNNQNNNYRGGNSNSNGNGQNGRKYYNNNNYNNNGNRNNNGGNRNNNYRNGGDNRNVRYAENCDAPQPQLGEPQMN